MKHYAKNNMSGAVKIDKNVSNGITKSYAGVSDMPGNCVML